MSAADLEPGGRAVIADEVEAPAAYFAADRWNGWRIPYFDRAGLTQLVDALDDFADENPDVGIIRLRLRADDMVQMLDPEDAEAGWQPMGGPVDVDGVPHWTPGGWSWTWYRIDDDAWRGWSISTYSHRATSTFYGADQTTDHTGARLYATADEARAAYAAEHRGDPCGPVWSNGFRFTCSAEAGHAGRHVPTHAGTR